MWGMKVVPGTPRPDRCPDGQGRHTQCRPPPCLVARAPCLSPWTGTPRHTPVCRLRHQTVYQHHTIITITPSSLSHSHRHHAVIVITPSLSSRRHHHHHTDIIMTPSSKSHSRHHHYTVIKISQYSSQHTVAHVRPGQVSTTTLCLSSLVCSYLFTASSPVNYKGLHQG